MQDSPIIATMPTTDPVQGDTVAPATSTIDPSVPSSESAPTALPTNPATSPSEAAEAAADTHPSVVEREVEKTRAAERELKGEEPAGTVVLGIEDDRLWAMLRRFDTQINHVLHPSKTPAHEPDLRTSTLPDLAFHSDTLKSNLERVVAALGPSSVRGYREVLRMTDWSERERWRTGGFAAMYFASWFAGYTIITLIGFAIVLVCFPGCRRWAFPPVPPPPFTPPSATDPTNQAGDESLLGNVDNKVVYRSKAEQAEEQAFEARAVFESYAHAIFLSGRRRSTGNAAVGEKTEEVESDDDDGDAEVPDNDKIQGLQAADAVIAGKPINADKPLSEEDKDSLARAEAKRRRDALVSKMAKATETGLGETADMMERLTNALSPPSAYPDRGARFKLAAAFLLPPALLLHFVPAFVFGRFATLVFGVAMWARPPLMYLAKEMDHHIDWAKVMPLLDLRNSILSGVPTDAQLTLHILRVAEAERNPIPRPPPPPLEGTPKEAIKDTSPAQVTADDAEEIAVAEEQGSRAEEAVVKAKVKTKSRILGGVKRVAKWAAGFHGDVAVDGHRKIGISVQRSFFAGKRDTGSPDMYPAKLKGKSGNIILDVGSGGSICISFVSAIGKSAAFLRPVDDIVEIKKSHVSMPRIALGWASGAEVEGLGLTLRFQKPFAGNPDIAGDIKVDDDGNDDDCMMQFKSVGRREQLFNRLIAAGHQRWEVL